MWQTCRFWLTRSRAYVKRVKTFYFSRSLDRELVQLLWANEVFQRGWICAFRESTSGDKLSCAVSSPAKATARCRGGVRRRFGQGPAGIPPILTKWQRIPKTGGIMAEPPWDFESLGTQRLLLQCSPPTSGLSSALIALLTGSCELSLVCWWARGERAFRPRGSSEQ